MCHAKRAGSFPVLVLLIAFGGLLMVSFNTILKLWKLQKEAMRLHN